MAVTNNMNRNGRLTVLHELCPQTGRTMWQVTALHSSPQPQIMESGTVSEMLDTKSTVTQLITKEHFIICYRYLSFRSFIYLNIKSNLMLSSVLGLDLPSLSFIYLQIKILFTFSVLPACSGTSGAPWFAHPDNTRQRAQIVTNTQLPLDMCWTVHFTHTHTFLASVL
jgi:hypothetical protein